MISKSLLVITLSLFDCLLNIKIEQYKDKNKSNIFYQEIKNYNRRKNSTTSYIISHKISRKFPELLKNKINIFISLINLDSPNILNISNNRIEYQHSYKTIINDINKVYMNSKNTSLILNKKQLTMDNTTIEFIFMKNRYFSQFSEINNKNLKYLNLYDINLIFTRRNLNETLLPKNSKIFQKETLDEIYTKCIESMEGKDGFFKDIGNIIKHKVEMHKRLFLKINNDLMKLKISNINLYNYLLIDQIHLIKKHFKNFKHELIYNKINNNMEKCDKIIDDFIKILNAFKINDNNSKIFFTFYIFTFICIIMVCYLIYQAINDLKIAYKNKMK